MRATLNPAAIRVRLMSRRVAIIAFTKSTMDILRSHTEVSMHTRARWFARTAQFAIVATAIVIAALIVWTFDRGLELTDEAFYVLTSMHPQALRFFFTPTQWVSVPLWQVAHGLAAFRALGWMFSTASAAVLGLGVAHSATRLAHWPAARRRLYQFAVVSATMVSAWLYGAILPFSPSYNLLGASGSYAAFGLFLLSIDRENRRQVTALAAASGICLGIAVLSKFSAGIATAGLIFVLQIVLRPRRATELRAAVVTAVALVGTVMIAIAAESTFSEASRQFLAGLELTRIAQGNETALARLTRGGNELWQCLLSVATTYSVPLVLACISLASRSAAAGCLAVAWFVYDVVALHTYLGGMDVYQTQSRPLVAAMAIMLALTLRMWLAQWRLAILTVALFVLPFAIAIGTGNPLPFQIVLALASWGALVSVLAFGTDDHSLRVPAIALAVVFTLLLAAQIASSGYRAPYRLAQPLQSQRIPIDLGRLGTLKVDPQTERFVTEVRSAWQHCGLPAQTPFIGIYRLPGVALVVDAVPLATPWLFSKGFADAALNGVGDDQLKRAAVALELTPDGTRPELPDRLQSVFPSAYRFCGAFSVPFDGARGELWAPAPAPAWSTKADRTSTSPVR